MYHLTLYNESEYLVDDLANSIIYLKYKNMEYYKKIHQTNIIEENINCKIIWTFQLKPLNKNWNSQIKIMKLFLGFALQNVILEISQAFWLSAFIQ